MPANLATIADASTKTAEHSGSGRLIDMVPGLAEALRTGRVVDVSLPDLPGEDEKLEGAVSVLVKDDVLGGDLLDGLEGEQAYLLVRNVLHHVKDYRTLLRSAFGKLAVEGWMVITVPHQFLEERKFRQPSRYRHASERFYTPASLLFEAQEALDPTTYRVRLLKDDDFGFDYGASLDAVPRGNRRIVLALQRIARPVWADEMGRSDDPRKPMASPEGTIVVDPDEPATQYIVTSSSPSIDTILVLKLDHRGDYELSLAALRDLRKLYPGARITLLCGSWNVEAAGRSGLFDEVLALDLVPEDASLDMPQMSSDQVEESLKALLGGRQFELAIDLSLHERTRPLLALIGARHKAGFDRWNRFPFLDIKLRVPTPSEEGSAMVGLLEPKHFATLKGRHRLFAIDVVRTRAPVELGEKLIWGPYLPLSPGEYELEFFLESFAGEQEVGFDVCYSEGKSVLIAGVLPVRRQTFPRLHLSLQEAVTGLEIRLYASNAGPLNFRFMGVGYRREGVIVGIHQLEAMALLVQLVALRLRTPYAVEAFPS